jgi:hypothetical protein
MNEGEVRCHKRKGRKVRSHEKRERTGMIKKEVKGSEIMKKRLIQVS